MQPHLVRQLVLVACVCVLLFASGGILFAQGGAPAPQPMPSAQEGSTHLKAATKKKGVDLYGDPLPPGALARMGTVRWRPGAPARTLAFSPNGKTLLTAGFQGLASFDVRSGRTVRRLPIKGSKDIVHIAAFSPDGKLLAVSRSTQSSARVFLYDVATSRELRALPAREHPIYALAFTPDGKTLATGGYDRVIRVWNPRTGRAIRALRGHTNWIKFIRYAPDGKTLASASSDATVRIWDVATGDQLLRLAHESTKFTYVAFCPELERLVTAGHAGRGAIASRVHLWDAGSGKMLRTLWTGKANHHTLALAYTPNGTVVAAGMNSGIRFWNAKTGKPLGELAPGGGVGDLVFSPDGRRLAFTSKSWGWKIGVVTSDRAAGRGWDPSTLKVQKDHGHVSAVNCLAFSPDSKTLATASSDKTVRLWDAKTGRELRSIDGQGYYYAIGFTENGKRVVAGGTDSVNFSDLAIRVWDTKTGRGQRKFRTSGGWNRGVGFSPNGRIAVAGIRGFNLPGRGAVPALLSWDTTTGREIREPLPFLNMDGAPAVFPDGRTLAIGAMPTAPMGAPPTPPIIQIVDFRTGKLLRQLRGHQAFVDKVIVSPDGRFLLSKAHELNLKESDVRVWDAKTGRLLHKLALPKGQSAALIFSPDSKMLATGGKDGVIRLWDTKTGRRLHTYRSPATIWCLTFSPDGRRLASGATDTTALLWDLMSRTKD